MRQHDNPLKVEVKRLAKTLLRPLLYRYPPIGLQPERLQLWLRTLIETSAVEGDVVEIGCSLGGTAAFSWRMLRNLGIAKRYVCVDTFAGFVPAQFDDDVDRGNRKRIAGCSRTTRASSSGRSWTSTTPRTSRWLRATS